EDDRFARRRRAFDALDDFFHLRAVGPGVHVERAADASRYAFRELQAAETAPRRLAHELRHGVGRADLDERAAALLAPVGALEVVAQADHRAAHAAVAHEQVAAFSEQTEWNVVRAQQLERLRERRPRIGVEKIIRRTADLHRRVARERLVPLHLQARD